MIEHMLSSLGKKQDLVQPDFIYEPKLDGVRAFLVKKGNTVRLINRRGRDMTSRYPELLLPKNIKAEDCLLDGEIIVYNAQGVPDFHLLMRRDQLSGEMQIRRMSRELPAVFVAFDVISYDGTDVSSESLLERKRILQGLLAENARIQTMYYTEDGLHLWDFIMQHGMEGVMAKRADSAYLPGRRTDNWLKIKNFKTQDCIIVGYSSGIRALSALALAAYDHGELRFLGKVGTGFSVPFLESLLPKLKRNVIESPSFPYPDRYKNITWVKPELVCEVQYLEFGPEGMLRNPSFLRLRNDKPMKDCIIELPKQKPRKTTPSTLISRRA